MTTAPASPALLDYDRRRATLPADARSYQQAAPYPHIVLDDFLRPEAAEAALAAFPAVSDAGWIHYVHVNEKKHGLNKMDLLPEAIQAVIREMNSPAFVAYLSELTGIPNLLPDDSLEGGGLHQSKRNGYNAPQKLDR